MKFPVPERGLKQTWIKIVPLLPSDLPNMWLVPSWASNLAWLCTKTPSVAFTNSKERENTILHKQSLITWVFLQGADISKVIQGQVETPNTCHCQISCRRSDDRPSKKKCQWWEHNIQILIACFFKAGPITHKDPPHSSLALNWWWPGNLRRIQVWQILEIHRCMLSRALLWYKRASQGAAI